ncbi:MFS transporter [Dickeya oryzae]|uniref:MFS transporter n=1 Tax=Dickeya oryzae TaxID=1240404 RepID=UPI001297F387|nr:MFS transporter [Dickeya oryzae]
MNAPFFFMLFLVLTADGLMVFLTPVIVYQLTGSIGYSGLSYALWWLPRVIIIPLVGTFIDKLGIRPLSIMSDVIKSAGCIFLALTEFSSNLMIAVSFGIIGSIISIGNSQTIITYEKLVSSLSKTKDHHANLISRMDFLGMIVGPLMGMLLIDYGFKIALILPCVFYTMNAVFFFFEKKNLRTSFIDIKQNDTIPSDSKNNIKDCALYLLSTPILIFTIFLAVGNNMFDGLVESSGAALIERGMNLPVKYFGLIDVAAGLCGVLGTYCYSYLRPLIGRKVLLLLAIMIIVSSSISLIAFKESFIVFIGCYALSIVGKVFTGNICRMIRIEVINPAMFASTSSLIVLLNQSVLPLIGLILYIAGDSTQFVYLLMAIGIVISSGAGFFLYRRMMLPEAKPDAPQAT